MGLARDDLLAGAPALDAYFYRRCGSLCSNGEKLQMDSGLAPCGVPKPTFFVVLGLPVKALDGGIPECDCVWFFGCPRVGHSDSLPPLSRWKSRPPRVKHSRSLPPKSTPCPQLSCMGYHPFFRLCATSYFSFSKTFFILFLAFPQKKKKVLTGFRHHSSKGLPHWRTSGFSVFSHSVDESYASLGSWPSSLEQGDRTDFSHDLLCPEGGMEASHPVFLESTRSWRLSKRSSLQQTANSSRFLERHWDASVGKAAGHVVSMEKGITTEFAKNARTQLLNGRDILPVCALDFLVCGAIHEPRLPDDGSMPNQLFRPLWPTHPGHQEVLATTWSSWCTCGNPSSTPHTFSVLCRRGPSLLVLVLSRLVLCARRASTILKNGVQLLSRKHVHCQTTTMKASESEMLRPFVLHAVCPTRKWRNSDTQRTQAKAFKLAKERGETQIVDACCNQSRCSRAVVAWQRGTYWRKLHWRHTRQPPARALGWVHGRFLLVSS